jgi:hypothetical protein
MRQTLALALAVGLAAPIAVSAVDLLDFPGPDYRNQRDRFSPPSGCFSSPLIKITPPVQFLEMPLESSADRSFKLKDPTQILILDNPFAEPIRIFDNLKMGPPKLELKDSPERAPKR